MKKKGLIFFILVALVFVGFWGKSKWEQDAKRDIELQKYAAAQAKANEIYSRTKVFAPSEHGVAPKFYGNTPAAYEKAVVEESIAKDEEIAIAKSQPVPVQKPVAQEIKKPNPAPVMVAEQPADVKQVEKLHLDRTAKSQIFANLSGGEKLKISLFFDTESDAVKSFMESYLCCSKGRRCQNTLYYLDEFDVKENSAEGMKPLPSDFDKYLLFDGSKFFLASNKTRVPNDALIIGAIIKGYEIKSEQPFTATFTHIQKKEENKINAEKWNKIISILDGRRCDHRGERISRN